MTTTLITGGNRGLGHTAAQRLIAAGQDVWIGARDPERGRAAADAIGARFVQVDVTSQQSVDAAVATVGPLDVLVNNAGILGSHRPLADVTAEDIEHVFATNVFGLARVTQAFLPTLLKSAAPVIVNVSSGMGSITVTGDPERLESSFQNLTYSPSKSAVNMLTMQLARAYPQVRINAVDPGYTATEFNGHSGPQTVQEGTDAIVAAAQIGPDGPTGTYVDRHGTVPW